MESNIKIEVPRYKLYKKYNYEPLLLECLNCSPFFTDMCDGFSVPESERNGECDAIGKQGSYDIDFKCLISEDGAENANETSLTKQQLLPGLTAIGPSKAYMREIPSLQFPNIWGFLVSGCLYLNENSEIELEDKTYRYMNKTIIWLNKTIYMKKNLLYFLPNRLAIESSNDIEILCDRAKEAFSIISKARGKLANGYDTYYALWLHPDKMVLLSDNFTLLDCIELTVLDSWQKLCRDYSWC